MASAVMQYRSSLPTGWSGNATDGIATKDRIVWFEEECAVILTSGPTLRAPLEDLKINVRTDPSAVTLNEAESSHILKTLRETNWVLGGPRGAAVRLGMKRITLISRMRRLGLSPALGLVV